MHATDCPGEQECDGDTAASVAIGAESTWKFGDDVCLLADVDIRSVVPRLLKPVSCVFSEHSAQVVILVLNAIVDVDTGYPPWETIEEIINAGRALALLAVKNFGKAFSPDGRVYASLVPHKLHNFCIPEHELYHAPLDASLYV